MPENVLFSMNCKLKYKMKIVSLNVNFYIFILLFCGLEKKITLSEIVLIYFVAIVVLFEMFDTRSFL
jgi:hypothetical protein